MNQKAQVNPESTSKTNPSLKEDPKTLETPSNETVKKKRSVPKKKVSNKIEKHALRTLVDLTELTINTEERALKTLRNFDKKAVPSFGLTQGYLNMP